ncbi:MAG TPA: ABC transporter permease, partial [Nannocystaceae bacterium]|nr:ABC transporter permease [Nannocystaceae bacterium]
MKAPPDDRRGPVRATRSALDNGEHWLLLVLFMSSWAFLLRLWDGEPTWIGDVGFVGLGALFLLVSWWAVTGFAGYEHRAGLKILRRTREAKHFRLPAVLALLATIAGIVALKLGVRNAPLVIATALTAGAAMVFVLARRFTVFATLSIVGIAIGVAALIVVQSVATGFQHEFERRVLGVYAHINVTRTFGISEYRRFEAHLRTEQGVVGASPFVYYAMALAPQSAGEGGAGDFRRASVLVKGIEPTTAHEVIDLDAHLRAGGSDVELEALTSDIELQPMPDRPDDRLPQVIADTPDTRGPDWYPTALARWRALPDSMKYGHGRRTTDDDDDPWPEADDAAPAPTGSNELPTMFVGVTLARELGLEVDDVVMLVDPGAGFDHTETPEFRRYRIAGIFRAGFQEYDSRLVYVHIRELQWFKYRGKDIVSGVDLRLADPYDAPAVEAVLRREIGDDEYSILEWQKLNANLFQSIRTQKSILTIILSLVSTVAGFNVLAALWTMVVRRTAEIAIMMSMGATESGVARIFQFTGMTLGAVGSIAGVAFGLVLCWLVELYGYTLDPEVYFIERLPVELSLAQIGAVLALTMV